MTPPARQESQDPSELEELTLSGQELDDLEEAEDDVEVVSYSGTDFDVEGLVRRLDRGDVIIPNFGNVEPNIESAAFQRGFVWRKAQMDRFVESLLLGYPIPGIMLVQQVDRRYLVLDGQQRLTTLQKFYGGLHDGKEFILDNVAKPFKGLSYKALEPDLRRTLDNTFIQATIVKTDGSKESLEAVYQVFERLNSGGTQLTAHEIRMALYPGALVDAITGLNGDAGWRTIYGNVSPRQRDHELILRVFALYVRSNEYRRPLKKFLNDFVAAHRDLASLDMSELRNLFRRATETFAAVGGRRLFRPTGRLNAALLEACFVAFMRLMNQRELTAEEAPETVNTAMGNLLNNEELLEAIAGSTAAADNVHLRLRLATEAFFE